MSDDPHQVQDQAELDEALDAPLFLLFKHSRTCPISGQAFAQYRAFLEALPGTPSAWLDVVGQRDLSRTVETRTHLRHESPQALLLSKGEVLWHASHGAITRAALAGAMLEVR